MLKARHVRTTFGCSDAVSRGRRKGFCTLSKVSKAWRFCRNFESLGSRDVWRGSARMHFPWQAQYKSHVHQRCCEVRVLISWERLHLGASDLQVCQDDSAWQVQHGAALRTVWPGITFSWQAEYFRQEEWKKHKRHWFRSALNFPFVEEVSQTCFVFDVVNAKNWGSLAELLRFWLCHVKNLRKSPA